MANTNQFIKQNNKDLFTLTGHSSYVYLRNGILQQLVQFFMCTVPNSAPTCIIKLGPNLVQESNTLYI